MLLNNTATFSKGTSVGQRYRADSTIPKTFNVLVVLPTDRSKRFLPEPCLHATPTQGKGTPPFHHNGRALRKHYVVSISKPSPIAQSSGKSRKKSSALCPGRKPSSGSVLRVVDGKKEAVWGGNRCVAVGKDICGGGGAGAGRNVVDVGGNVDTTRLGVGPPSAVSSRLGSG